MKLSSFLRLSSKTTNPQANPSVVYNLYSLPSFDDGRKCEVVHGSEIQSNKFIVPDKCILFNKLNVRFKRIWRIDNTEPNKIASTEFLPLVVDESIVDFHYCYYLLRSDRITDYLTGQNTNTSGSHKRIDPDNFFDIEVSLPPLEDQKRIGEVLSNLDMKIDINTSLNHYLEAMAKQLYDYWFVQFDFPDANGKPYKSSGGNMIWNEKLKREIPEGWSSEIFSELCDINKLTLSKRDNIPTIEYLDTSSITEGIVSETQYLDRHSAPSRAQRKVEDLTIVYSCVRPRLLHYGILCNPPTNFIVSTGFATIDAKDKAYSILLYYFLISCETTEHLGDIADTAVSSYPAINPSDIGSLRTIVPPRSLSLSFQEKVEVMIREAKRLHLENKELEKKRDYLLPLVMTGQVSVKQLNNDL